MLVIWFLLLSAFLAVYLGVPFFRKPRLLYTGNEALEDLMLERERTYQALLDLEFDCEAGKLSEEDYQILRRQLLNEAAQVLAHIDRVQGEHPRVAASETQAQDWVEAEIERFKRRRRKTNR